MVVPAGRPSMIRCTSSGLRYSQPAGGRVTVPPAVSGTVHGLPTPRAPGANVPNWTWQELKSMHSQSVTCTMVVPGM